MFKFNNFFMSWLEAMDETTPHTSKFHKESFYEHTLTVAYNAAINNTNRQLFIAALLHDIGKPETVVVREGKGATFYDHETHIDCVKLFLSEDDEDYEAVCDLIKYHMIPYKLNGPEPWRSFAEKTLLEIVHTHSSSFVSNLFALNDYDIKGTFSKKAPPTHIKQEMRQTVIGYATKLGL